MMLLPAAAGWSSLEKRKGLQLLQQAVETTAATAATTWSMWKAAAKREEGIKEGIPNRTLGGTQGCQILWCFSLGAP